MKIVIADDHALFREGLKVLLELESNYQVITEVDNAESLKEFVIENQPELVIQDYNMPGGGAVSTLEYLKKRFSNIKVIILTGVNSGALFQQVFSAGADGIFLKEMSAQEMIIAIKKVVNGEQVFSETVKEYLSHSQPKLTGREFQVMDLIVSGLSTNEIAEKLSLSAKTVENHRYNLMQKLDLKNSIELMLYAQKQGLLSST